MNHKAQQTQGFTLVEMAMVLLIIGVLLGGLIGPLTSQLEQKRFSDTNADLDEIKEALLGYAAINGRLPCPSTEGNPANAGYGMAPIPPNCAQNEGFLPWKTLGVLNGGDAWTGRWRYRVHPKFAVSGIKVTTTVPESPDYLRVQNGAGQFLTASPSGAIDADMAAAASPIAIVYSTGPDGQPNGENAVQNWIYQADGQGNNFDDVLIWISRPALINRMIAAGQPVTSP